MPNSIPFATKADEERRAWVTTHHEVVRLIKDCFGDRFSNNEIFDRLKISRRTGYRCLDNNERIGKAPGRKPKLSEVTIKSMVEYIESGGCTNVGNVWRHLADKFAPDCSPKLVQDAVKKSGFKNYRDSVKLEPLLHANIAEDEQVAHDNQSILHDSNGQHVQHIQPVHQMHEQHHGIVDPIFHAAPSDALRAAIEGASENHVRWVLQDLCNNIPDAARLTSSFLCPYVIPTPQPMTTSQTHSALQTSLSSPVLSASLGKRRRLAVCRRCCKQYDRAINTMDTRECLYHKGSPQKIAPEDVSLDQSSESFIWSCCGGNGAVRGCCRAMHTTKKRRIHGDKRDAAKGVLEEAPDIDDESNAHVVDGHCDISPPGGSMIGDHDQVDVALQNRPSVAISI